MKVQDLKLSDVGKRVHFEGRDTSVTGVLLDVQPDISLNRLDIWGNETGRITFIINARLTIGRATVDAFGVDDIDFLED